MDAGFTNPVYLQQILDGMTPGASHAKLGKVIRDLIAHTSSMLAFLNSRMLTKAGLVIHGAGGTVPKAGSAFCAVANGTLVRKPANTDMSALAGNLATAKSALWAFYIDSAGTITTSAKTADAASHDAALALMPAVPAGKAMIGFVVIDNATGSNFVGGTTALDTGSLTVTYYDAIGPGPVAPAAVGDLGTR